MAFLVILMGFLFFNGVIVLLLWYSQNPSQSRAPFFLFLFFFLALIEIKKKLLIQL